MSFTMEDNLESEWVSVRPRVFDEKERHKFVFIVAWNEIEGKFAITCHNRTVQRRTTFLLDPLVDDAPACTVLLSPGASVAEKHTKSKKDEVCQAGKVRPLSVPKGRPTTKAVVADTNALKHGGAKTSECVSPTLGSWDIVTPKVMEIEILDPVDVQVSAEDADPGDGYGDISGREDFSWAGVFSFQDLKAAHLQLCAVNSDLEPCLPSFPEEQSGVWSVLFGASGVSQRETDALCYQLQVYLGHALDTCGWKILSEVLFSESEDTDEYYESLSELRQKGYKDALERAKRRMQEVLDRHKSMDSMVELLQVYPEEDEAYGELLEATTQLYHYLLQPFRDMRELAMLRRQQIKISLETERLGPRRVESLRKEDEEWQKKAHTAVLSIQDLTVKFFETTTRAQKALNERMRADQRKFGKSAWAAAVERMERLQYAVSKETLQLMRAKEICLEQRKHGLKEEMQGLQGGEEAMLRLDQLEALYYELQLQLYDIQAEVLRCEELLLTAQLQSLRRQMTERQDEVVYYDAFESPDAMKGEEDRATPPSPLRDEELSVLQQRTRQLEARRGRITAKKVYLKKKKEICIVNHNQKIQHQQGSHGNSLQTLQQKGTPGDTAKTDDASDDDVEGDMDAEEEYDSDEKERMKALISNKLKRDKGAGKTTDPGEEEREKKTSRSDELRKEARQLKKELQAIKQRKEVSSKPEVDEAKEVDEKPANEAVAEYLEGRKKYEEKRKQKLKKGSSREQQTLELLNRFKSKLSSAITEEAPEDAVEELAEDDDKGWMAHVLQFDEQTRKVKDAAMQDEDTFEIYDPRNPVNKRRREESKKIMKEKKAKVRS